MSLLFLFSLKGLKEMQEYEFKCEECKRPAPYVTDIKGNKKPLEKCDMPNCKGDIKLVND